MNTTATILKAARDLIAKPENWTQGEYAISIDGYVSSPIDDDACKLCSVGAVARILGIRGSEAEDHDAVRVLNDFSGDDDVIKFNDSHTHSEVLDLFSKAIKAAEGEQS